MERSVVTEQARSRVILGYSLIVLLSVIIAVGFAIIRPESVSADAPNLSTYERCQALAGAKGNSFGENGVIDYIWMAPESGDRYIVPQGATSIRVKVIGEMSLCATHATRKAVGYIDTTRQRSDNIHTINSETNPNAPDNGRLIPDGNLDYGWVTKKNGDRVTVHREIGATLNIQNWAMGSHRICIVSNTWTSVNTQWYAPGDPNCQTINLEYAWTTSAQSLVGVGENQTPNVTSWTAVPGNMLHWRHAISASGGTTPSLGFAVGKSGFTGNAWGNGASPNNIDPQGSTPAIGPGSSYTIGWQANRPEYSSYRVQQSDVGNTLCQSISWGPRAYDNSAWDTSGAACVSVPYNYNLIPLVDLNVSGVVEPDSQLTVKAQLDNKGPTKSRNNTQWQLVRMVLPSTAAIPNSAVGGQQPCQYYGNGCTPIETGNSGGSGYGLAITDLISRTESALDIEVGRQICYATAVQPYNQSSGDWRYGQPSCVRIGKKPKVQVWGSDLSVGRYFANDNSPRVSAVVDTSTSAKAGGTKTFGSWVEYGIFASGTVRGASAAGLAGPDGNSSSSQGEWDKLTFANAGHTGTSGCNGTIKFGCYTVPAGTGSIPDVAARLVPTATTGSPLTGTVSLDGRSGAFYANGNLTISGGTIGKSNSVIIRASGTITISGDIRYTTDSLSSISEIPQVVIIADSIRINDNVTNVDSWLVANGSNGHIYTCGSNDFTQVLTSNTCKDKLTINGPVMAKKLYLTRTSGSGTGAASGEPAEVLNLRADAYLWAIGRSGGLGSVQTINTRELAPRF